jgi:hypothetical protein
VRWQASAVARSPARPWGAIGEKEWCAVFVVKFVNHFNLTLSYWRGEEELTGAKEGGDAELD